MGRPADRSHLSIREVLDLVLEEFPDVTISKIRFLESRGLIHPERTPSGYRKFYEADVERLRWILRQQREHFLPLKVIKGRLEQYNGSFPTHVTPSLFDLADGGDEEDLADPGRGSNGAARAELPVDEEPSGRSRHPSATPMLAAAPSPAAPEAVAPVQPALNAPVADAPAPGVPVSDAPAAAPSGIDLPDDAVEEIAPAVEEPPVALPTYSRDELVTAARATEALVCELEEYGLISHRILAGNECFDEQACQTLALAARFRGFGIEARHLKMLKHAAEREAGLFSQVITPLLRQRNPSARERAEEDLAELVSLGAALRSVFVTRELRGFTGG